MLSDDSETSSNENQLMGKISIARRRLEARGRIGFTTAELRAERRDNGAKCDLLQYEPVKRSASEIAFRLTSDETHALEALTSGEKTRKSISGKLQQKKDGVFVLNIERVRPLENNLLSSRDVAELLGISADTLYRHVREGRIRAYKVGGVFRFREKEILDFLASSEL